MHTHKTYVMYVLKGDEMNEEREMIISRYPFSHHQNHQVNLRWSFSRRSQNNKHLCETWFFPETKTLLESSFLCGQFWFENGATWRRLDDWTWIHLLSTYCAPILKLVCSLKSLLFDEPNIRFCWENLFQVVTANHKILNAKMITSAPSFSVLGFRQLSLKLLIIRLDLQTLLLVESRNKNDVQTLPIPIPSM